MPDPFADDFGRADSGTLGNCPVTPSGTPLAWVQQDGTMGIASGRAVATSSSGLATLDCGGANGDYQVTIADLATAAPRFIFRATNANNYVLIQAYAGTYSLYSVSSGTIGGEFGGGVAIPGAAPANGDVVRVSLYNQYVVVSINGVVRLQIITGSYQSGTLVGFAWVVAAGAKFDDFSFTPTDPSAVKSLVVCEGDSLTLNPDSTNCYPERLRLALGAAAWDMANVATGGDTLANMLGEAASQVDTLYDASRPTNLAILFAGTNDIFLNGESTANLQTWTRTWCEGRRSAGFEEIAVGTMLARKGDGVPPDQESKRQAHNAWLRANYTDFADYLFDFAADPRIGLPDSPDDTTYFQTDKTHQTAAGAQVQVDVIIATLFPFNLLLMDFLEG